MKLVRREWKPGEADDWSREDWIAIILSPLAYVLIAIGVGLSILLLPIGFITLIAGIIITIIMHWVIDPKLKSISLDYEEKQKEYLEELEKKARWGKHHG